MKRDLGGILENISDPVTRGTLRIASDYVSDSLRNSKENHKGILDFLGILCSFYRKESAGEFDQHESRRRFSEIDISYEAAEPFMRAMLKATANSVIDSLGDPLENHGAVYEFLAGMSRSYRKEAVEANFLRKKYRELSKGEKHYIFNEYLHSGMTRKEFVRSSNLSSVYALDKIRKDFETSETKARFAKEKNYIYLDDLDPVPLGESLNRDSIMVADSVA